MSLEAMEYFYFLTPYNSVSQPGFRRTSSGVPREIVEQINTNFEIPRKIPNIPRNIAGIFVRQLAVLE
jgi:hypothetical protein